MSPPQEQPTAPEELNPAIMSDASTSDVATMAAKTAGLHGIRVACFYPWVPFLPSGAWTRFIALWKYLHFEGASVTMAFLQKGDNAQLKDVAVRFTSEHTIVDRMFVAGSMIASLPATSELRKYGPMEMTLLLRYEKGLYLATPGLPEWLDEIIRTHDVVTCEYPLYAPLLSDFCKKWHKPLVVTSHDVLYELHGSHPRARERLKEQEIEAMRHANALVFVNDEERKLFGAFGLSGITVLNTTDVLSVTPGRENESCNSVRGQLNIQTPQYCLFVGTKHLPNTEAVAEVRKLARAMPDITFVVAGTCCPPVREGNFIALGFVSDETLDLLYRGALSIIIPLVRGTGTSVKTIQALAYGKPIVATAAGVRGYAVADGQEALVVSIPGEFPRALRRVIESPGLRRSLGQKARKYAETLDYRAYFKPYADTICRLLGRSVSVACRRSPALILVDNNLRDRIGHHFSYALSLKNECIRADIPFHALMKCTADTTVVDQLGGKGAFSQGIHEGSRDNPFPAEWADLRSTYDFLQSNVRFADELESALAPSARPGDVIFLPNATPRQLLAIALLLTRSPLLQTLRFVLLLRYSIYGVAGPITNRKVVRDEANAALYRTALEKLTSFGPTVVRLATDSAQLATEYAEICRQPIELLPIPHTNGPNISAPLDGVPPKSERRIRVVYLGDAREEKGFELLPGIVRGCLAAPSLPPLEFVFQTFISSHHHRNMAASIAQLRDFKNPDVHLVQRPLSSDEYAALLDSADVVLLPYDAGTYRSRTSGPFVEAICAGKPVVVPRESWMSLQLKGSRAGATFESGSVSDFVRAVGAVVSDIAASRDAAAKLGCRFRAYHNPATFVARLLGRGDVKRG